MSIPDPQDRAVGAREQSAYEQALPVVEAWRRASRAARAVEHATLKPLPPDGHLWRAALVHQLTERMARAEAAATAATVEAIRAATEGR